MKVKHKITFAIILNRDRNVLRQGASRPRAALALAVAQGTIATKADSRIDAGHHQKIYHYFLLFLSLFFFTVSSSAQRILSLEEAIANTLQKNYDIILSGNDSTI